MPDPELLPPGRSISSAAPNPAGLPGITARASRRRRAKAASAGATAIASVAAAFAVLASGGINDALTTVNPPARQPLPTDSRAVSSPATTQMEGPGIPPIESLAPSVPTLPPSARPTVGVAQHATPSPSSRPVDGEVGPPMELTSYDVTRRCDGSGPTVAQGWCSYYDGATSGRGGQAVELAASVCRLTGQGSGTLTFDSGLRADFDAGRDTYPASWRSSRGHRFTSAASTTTVPAGKCARWHVTWTVVDDKGKALAPGSYYLDARPTARAGSGSVTNQASERFTVTG